MEITRCEIRVVYHSRLPLRSDAAAQFVTSL